MRVKYLDQYAKIVGKKATTKEYKCMFFSVVKYLYPIWSDCLKCLIQIKETVPLHRNTLCKLTFGTACR